MLLRIKIRLYLAFFWLFDRREYKRAMAFRKACRSPKVQAAFGQVVKAVIDKVARESEDK
jgi:hypothetical protein